jgi:hypothetical protein
VEQAAFFWEHSRNPNHIHIAVAVKAAEDLGRFAPPPGGSCRRSCSQGGYARLRGTGTSGGSCLDGHHRGLL